MTGNYNIPDRETTPNFNELDDNVIFDVDDVKKLSSEVFDGVNDLIYNVIFDFDRGIYNDDIKFEVLKELVLKGLINKLSDK